MILYHGTNSRFNKFSKDAIGKNTEVATVGFFLTDNIETAKSYGNIVLKCEVDLGAYIECDFNNSCHTFFIDKEYTSQELAVKINELNEILEANSNPTYCFDIETNPEIDEETGEILSDKYWSEEDLKDYLDSLGEFDHLYDDKIDTVICKNIKDNMDFGGVVSNNYIVFDENRIKILGRVSEMKEAFNDAFYKWFGNSKVVDEQGEPLIVYHGSEANFNSFNKSLLGSATKRNLTDWYDKETDCPSAYLGFFFTDDEDFAREYGGILYECYLKILNPLIVDMHNYENTDEILTKFLEQAYKEKRDGIIFKNIKELGRPIANEYVVFEPNQIKEIANHGQWSNSDNIYETLNVFESLNNQLKQIFRIF